MDLSLKGRLALVTGSTSGLGKAIAMALAMEGADVIINGRDREKLNQTAIDIGLRSLTNIHNCCADATKTDEIKNFFEENWRWLTKLDILVNNVGNIEKFGSFADLKDKDWLRCYDLTFMSAVRFTREALPFLTASGNGRIINISSLPSHQPGAYNPHNSAAKASLNNLTKYLANMLGNKNILVNAICPSTLDGGTWKQNVADRSKRCGLSTEEAEQTMKDEEFKKSPLCRMGTLDNVANLVVYLASDRAAFQTGHIYDVDGGITRGL